MVDYHPVNLITLKNYLLITNGLDGGYFRVLSLRIVRIIMTKSIG